MVTLVTDFKTFSCSMFNRCIKNSSADCITLILIASMFLFLIVTREFIVVRVLGSSPVSDTEEPARFASLLWGYGPSVISPIFRRAISLQVKTSDKIRSFLCISCWRNLKISNKSPNIAVKRMYFGFHTFRAAG